MTSKEAVNILSIQFCFKHGYHWIYMYVSNFL
jgi:hypothetical protein